MLAYNTFMDYRDRIISDSMIRFGKPIVKGTRLTVAEIMNMLANGDSVGDILQEYPQLTQDDLRACFAYAADRERMTRLA